jgi:hypothetical protein
MPNHVLTTRVVLTYSQLEQEVESLREQVEFYRTELENLLEKLEMMRSDRDEQ